VVECDKEDGANPVPLPPDDPRRKAYLKVINDQEMVMRRLRLSWEEIQALEREREQTLENLAGGEAPPEKLPWGSTRPNDKGGELSE